MKTEVENRFGAQNHNVKFNIVAHSMGARYYLRYGTQDLPADGSLPELTWAGAEYVERVIFIGTPNAGSIDSFKFLVDGVELLPSLPNYDAAILGTMPSVYQLIPRARHRVLFDKAEPEVALDIGDPGLWERPQWGLLDPEKDDTLKILLPQSNTRAERAEIAKDYLVKSLARANQSHRTKDRLAQPPADLSIYLIAGDADPTYAVVAVDMNTGTTSVHAQGPVTVAYCAAARFLTNASAAT